MQTNGGDVHAIDDDGPSSRLDQPEEREGQRGFAGTGPAHDTYLRVSTRSTREQMDECTGECTGECTVQITAVTRSKYAGKNTGKYLYEDSHD